MRSFDGFDLDKRVKEKKRKRARLLDLEYCVVAILKIWLWIISLCFVFMKIVQCIIPYTLLHNYICLCSPEIPRQRVLTVRTSQLAYSSLVLLALFAPFALEVHISEQRAPWRQVYLLASVSGKKCSHYCRQLTCRLAGAEKNRGDRGNPASGPLSFAGRTPHFGENMMMWACWFQCFYGIIWVIMLYGLHCNEKKSHFHKYVLFWVFGPKLHWLKSIRSKTCPYLN